MNAGVVGADVSLGELPYPVACSVDWWSYDAL